MKRRLTYILQAATVILLVACSSDTTDNEDGYGLPARVSMNIGNRRQTTRATGTPEPAQADIEKIHTWQVAFVDRQGTVRKVVNRPADRTAYVEEETMDVEIPTGTYTLYAFANVDPVSDLGLTFTEGSPCPADVETRQMELKQDWPADKDIPMSGKQTVTVTGRANETFSVEVVRMLAKTSITFTNESSRNITVNSLSLSQSATDEVPLLPNYEWLDNGWPIPEGETPSAGNARDYVRSYSGKVLQRTGEGASFTDVFYVRESQANYNVSQRYLMQVNIKREGEENEDLLFALTRELQSIYRNDHIVIPIILSDYQVSLTANFYPPIGGYPAVITQESKEEFFCEFATQGVFELTPRVEDSSNGYALLYGTGDPYYTYRITATSDPAGIFLTPPSVSSTTGEILGELGPLQGTAYVDVEITVKKTGATDQVYERRIYIIRKNK